MMFRWDNDATWTKTDVCKEVKNTPLMETTPFADCGVYCVMHLVQDFEDFQYTRCLPNLSS